MNKTSKTTKVVAIAVLFCMSTQPTLAALLNLATQPLFIGASIPPKVMLTISKDQQLIKKAYNDYSDLDGDGQLETTYKHSIDYYGYFDSYKCYSYSTSNGRFEPTSVTADKYCAGGWSGNFLNWLSMARMDTVRKLLYGGMRSTDQTFASGGANAVTVLERAYLPPDAHAWAKYYNGADIAQLTPFTVATTPTSYSATTSSSFAIPGASGDYDITFTAAQNANMAIGDQIKVQRTASSSTYLIGTVLGFADSNRRVSMRVHLAGIQGSGSDTSWTVSNLTRTGISFCNVTTGSSSGSDSRSSTNTRPPLIRVARGNYQLWNANERWQCQWVEERSNTQGSFPGGLRSNGNQASLSELNASAENPSQTADGLGTGSATGEFIARVQVCVPTLIGEEKCKQYPNGNYKPVGLLQEYGDLNLIHFGLMTGSYAKNISGGVLRKNIGTFTDETNETTDGTFVQPLRPPGSPRTKTSAATSPGIVNTLNYMRIYGYYYGDGTYLDGTNGDNCNFQLTNISENNCTSWGNPMSEVYFESIRYFAGKTATAAYSYSSGSSTKDNELGLPIATWSDPLSGAPYCSPLHTLVFNASVSTNDDDLRATSGTDFNAAGTTIAALANAVGTAEGITGGSYPVGKMLGGSATPSSDAGFELCTPKTIDGLGDVSGICPEGPTLAGSYLLTGIAHKVHTNRIRTDISVPATDLKSLRVTSYGIQLATNVPQILIPVPGASNGQQVMIQPVYRLNVGGANGGGAIVDLKIVRQSTDGSVSTGKVYINWEDSEQGGDYDQDMWGTIDWVLNAAANTITVTTDAIAASTVNPQGFGYAISGTTKDGPHYHSGIYGFNYTDSTGVLGCTNCQLPSASSGQRGPQSVTYTLAANSSQPLKDPLWYLAKYGGFTDSNNNGLPDQQKEWDRMLSNGTGGQDGIPDNYFLVSNPLGLEAALNQAFLNILKHATAAAVATNSTSLQTYSKVYQARFASSDWSGQLLAYGLTSNGTMNVTPDWDAGEVINTQSWTSRTILTFNDTATVRQGVAFRWPLVPASPGATDISTTLISALNKHPDTGATDNRGSNRLRYLRGDATQEVGSNRMRMRPMSMLGDIVNSEPAYVGPPDSAIPEASYAAFRTANASRAPVLYVGANDGMLHAFEAATGREILGYVPSKTFSRLNKLTSLNYTHRYYVDGSPEIQDAQVAGSWKTVLVGGLGGGGHGLYALDVTNPTSFSEANAASVVLWEFNDTDDTDLGYVYGKPLIRKMANGRWGAIVQGGYHTQGDSVLGTGRAVLFIIFLDGPSGPNRTWVAGTDYVKIDTAIGDTTTPNALAPPFAIDRNLDGKFDYIYAGDLRGNFWKFDVSSPTVANWTAAGNRVVLFQARDGGGAAQPITAPAEGTVHPTGQGYVMSFGTGKYMETSDPSGPYAAQSYYGIWDKDDSVGSISVQTTVTSRAQLLQQTISIATADTGENVRVISDSTADWSTDSTPPNAGDAPTRHVGWYMDFASGTSTGERAVYRPLLLSNRLIFSTVIPSTGVCSNGGTSFLYVIDPATGARIGAAVLDIDGNGVLNTADKVTVGGTRVFASSVEAKVGIMPTPTVVLGGSTVEASGSGNQIYGTTGPLTQGWGQLLAYAIGCGSTGNCSSTVIGLGALSGRVSWREVIDK
ncbi:MAG: pilus assembly protein [Burkholderiales bacterium]